MSAQAWFFPAFWRAEPELVPNTERPLAKSAAASALHPAVAGAPERTSDRVLLGRVAAGDVAALRLVYNDHAPRAMAIARRILRNVEEAEDIVQETFLELRRPDRHHRSQPRHRSAALVQHGRTHDRRGDRHA